MANITANSHALGLALSRLVKEFHPAAYKGDPTAIGEAAAEIADVLAALLAFARHFGGEESYRYVADNIIARIVNGSATLSKMSPATVTRHSLKAALEREPQ